MLELWALAASILFFLVCALIGDAIKQRRRQRHFEAIEWAIWAHRQRQLAAAYNRRINGL